MPYISMAVARAARGASSAWELAISLIFRILSISTMASSMDCLVFWTRESTSAVVRPLVLMGGRTTPLLLVYTKYNRKST